MLVHVMPNGTNWRVARTSADLTSKEAAACLEIERKTLLNIETNQPRATVSELLARRAARVYRVRFEDLVILGGGSGEGVPDEPPSREQERETNTGPGRDSTGGTTPGKGGRTGPSRVRGSAA